MADKKSVRSIDAHTHPFGNRGLDLSPYISCVRDPILMRRRHPEVFKEMLKGTDDLTEDLIVEMDQFGSDKALIQSCGVGTNEYVARAVKKHPDRLSGLFRPVSYVTPGHVSPRTTGHSGGVAPKWGQTMGDGGGR